MPTLLNKGNLKETKKSPPQSELDKYVPIEYIIKKLTKMRASTGSVSDRLLVLRSSTGSGKSTVFPAELFHVFFKTDQRNIVSTQPRVFNAIQVPNQITPFQTAEFLKSIGKPNRTPIVLGENIGYQTGSFVKLPTRGIIFMTIGSLVRQLLNMTDDVICKTYSFIIVDEAHENSIDASMMHYFLKELLRRCKDRIDCPIVVVTSATFDPYRFADYYEAGYETIVDVLGLTFPVSMHFLDNDTSNYINSAIDIISKIHRENSDDFSSKKIQEDTEFRDILVFVGGKQEIDAITKKMEDLNKTDEFFKKNPVAALALTGGVVASSGDDFQNLFKSADELGVKRRVIIATEVGETGITYPYLKYVVDSGFHKSQEFSPDFGIEYLMKKPITQDIVSQRKGRVGRQAPGQCHLLYSESTYNKMNEQRIAQMYKDDITLTILDLIKMKTDPENLIFSSNMYDLFNKNVHYTVKDTYEKIPDFDITEVDLIDRPAPGYLTYSFNKLYKLGFIDMNSKLTTIGLLSFKFFRSTAEQVKMILSAYAWGASVEDITLCAAALYHRESFLYSRGMHKKYIKEHKFLHRFNKIANCDFMMYMSVVNSLDFANIGSIREQCDERGLNYDGLCTILEWRDDVFNTLCILGLNPYDDTGFAALNNVNTDEEDIINYCKKIKHCLYEGLKLNLSKRTGEGKYETVETNVFMRNSNDCDGHYIIYDKLVAGFGPIQANRISVLDGFLQP